jgi:hypothetical protein
MDFFAMTTGEVRIGELVPEPNKLRMTNGLPTGGDTSSFSWPGRSG